MEEQWLLMTSRRATGRLISSVESFRQERGAILQRWGLFPVVGSNWRFEAAFVEYFQGAYSEVKGSHEGRSTANGPPSPLHPAFLPQECREPSAEIFFVVLPKCFFPF